jgi:hypothetical protein
VGKERKGRSGCEQTTLFKLGHSLSRASFLKVVAPHTGSWLTVGVGRLAAMMAAGNEGMESFNGFEHSLMLGDDK